MAWWKKILGGELDSQRVDYYQEGLELLKEGRFHEGLTSLRLMLKESPGDVAVLQQIAIAYTRIGMTEEAAKTYRSALEWDPSAPGAHYGLAFLLLREGQEEAAARHLEAFLSKPPRGPDAAEHVAHARATLAELIARSAPDATDAGA